MLIKRHLSVFVGLLLYILQPMVILSAEYYDNKTLIEESKICLDCHDDQIISLAGSAHQITDKEGDVPLAVGCIGCHDGWRAHLEDPSSENITDLKSYSLFDLSEVCGQCHRNPHQIAMLSTDPHSRTDISCLSCHKIHDNPHRMLVRDEDDNYCAACHTGVAAEFKRRSVHPLEAGNIGCTDCHHLGNIKDNLFTAGFDWTCQECHDELAGPYIYEHEVTYNHLVEGGGCVECHEPHGSTNDRLLMQPGNGVCLQCHGVPPRHRTAHSGLGTRLGCVDCHTEIHGSNENRCYLDPDLGVKLFPDCYQSGCHAFGR